VAITGAGPQGAAFCLDFVAGNGAGSGEAVWAMADLIGKRLGDFEIVRELGRGGMGVVYEARQISLNRQVALKVLSGSLGLTAKAVQRFRREAEAAAKLHHTNIVPVYATGEQDGAHFYAMELIEGPSLDHVIRHMRQPGENATPVANLDATGPYVPQADSSSNLPSPLSSSSLGSGGGYFDAVARMVAEVADALDYAHRNGVIHRDVKPSNLLLSPQGRLSVNDFGLARVLEQPGMTLTGEFVGTPAYTSPEQVTAGRIPLDHRTDVYSLGATLYELLTLQPPFTGKQRDQVLAQIVQKEPKAPRKLNKKVPLDLETICLKALEKDPDRRYQTAGQMAEDLRRYVNRFAIAARRAGPVHRLVKWARRHPAVAASLGCLLVAVGVAFAFAYQAHRAEQRRLEEQQQARRELLDEKIRNAYQVASSGDLKRTDEAIKEIEPLGASHGQVRLLRGMVAYFRGDSESAISELEQAVKLLPESVAAWGLLAVAYSDYGQAERGERVILELQVLAPTSPEDYLFKGYARDVFEPGTGLPDLDEGIRQRNSLLGRALRAIVRSNRAIDTASREDTEAALSDANAARSILPTHPLVLQASLWARLVAAGFYQDAGLMEQRKAVLQEAARDVQALDSYIEHPGLVWIMHRYFEEIGDLERSLDVGRRSMMKSKSPLVAMICAFVLYRQNRIREGLECLDRRQQGDLQGDITRAFLVAELPDGARRAFDEYEKITKKYPAEGLELRFRSDLLLLLGRKEQALASCRRFRVPALSQDWREFNEAWRQFGCGELSEETFLAKAGASRYKKVIVHYEAGLFRLAVGDRVGAREHFQKAVATRTFPCFQYPWCQMFLGRLEKDRTWPKWIGPMKGNKKP
jgi:tetratricopeptide (TPR) repeat protein